MCRLGPTYLLAGSWAAVRRKVVADEAGQLPNERPVDRAEICVNRNLDASGFAGKLSFTENVGINSL